jgi:hypothetical protein
MSRVLPRSRPPDRWGRKQIHGLNGVFRPIGHRIARGAEDRNTGASRAPNRSPGRSAVRRQRVARHRRSIPVVKTHVASSSAEGASAVVEKSPSRFALGVGDDFEGRTSPTNRASFIILETPARQRA